MTAESKVETSCFSTKQLTVAILSESSLSIPPLNRISVLTLSHSRLTTSWLLLTLTWAILLFWLNFDTFELTIARFNPSENGFVLTVNRILISPCIEFLSYTFCVDYINDSVCIFECISSMRFSVS